MQPLPGWKWYFSEVALLYIAQHTAFIFNLVKYTIGLRFSFSIQFISCLGQFESCLTIKLLEKLVKLLISYWDLVNISNLGSWMFWRKKKTFSAGVKLMRLVFMQHKLTLWKTLTISITRLVTALKRNTRKPFYTRRLDCSPLKATVGLLCFHTCLVFFIVNIFGKLWSNLTQNTGHNRNS